MNKMWEHTYTKMEIQKKTSLKDSASYSSFNSSYPGAGRNKNDVRWKLSRYSMPRKNTVPRQKFDIVIGAESYFQICNIASNRWNLF